MNTDVFYLFICLLTEQPFKNKINMYTYDILKSEILCLFHGT